MATAEKISISLGPDDLEWARRRAKNEVKSVSAVIAEALRLQRQAEARARLLADLGTDDITEAEREQVRNEWRAPRVNPARATRRAKKRARK
jgi:Arc/MetJ-type ribon-helix-helix transcriptional regulator